MNITFLIGNGFDLNLGLATKFNDFLKVYTKPTDSDSALIRAFKEHVLTENELWANAEMAFGQYTAAFNPTAEVTKTADDFCECYEHFCRELASYLSKEEERINFTSLSKFIGNVLPKSLLGYLSGFREVEKQSLLEAQKGVSGGEIFNFINFNYTTTLDMCLAAIPKRDVMGTRTYGNTRYSNGIGTLIHVHGYTSHDMILGVNDESQVANSTLFDGYGPEYINEIIKVKANAMAEQNTDEKAHSLLRTSDVIYIYGMSLGKTDILWWQRICERLHKNPALHVIIHCFDAPERTHFSRLHHKYAGDKRREFVSYCDLPADVKQQITQRIHIDDSNIFSKLYKLVEHSDNKPLSLEGTPECPITNAS
nr:bacteriophage abortive infection AbiH family protein [Clostridia bacterium]